MNRVTPGERVNHFIHGEEVPSQSAKTFVSVDPSTGEALAEVALGDADDVDRAVASASEAFTGDWAKVTPSDRAAALRRVGEIIHQRAEEIAAIESRDSGKPIAQARAEIHGSAEGFVYYASHAENPRGDVYPAEPEHFLYSSRVPYGVVAAISPWNYPFHIASHKVAPALAAGNTVVLKPAEQSPMSAMALAHAVLDAGIPPGVLNVVQGEGAGAGAALVAHRDVPKISFTGSTGTGRAILRSATDRIKSVHLELGGKSPNIVFADADLDQAIAGSLFTAFKNSGQICTSGARLLVQRSIASEFTEMLLARAGELVVGDPLEPHTQMGPLISAEQRGRVASYIEGGISEGAQLSLGGSVQESAGFFVEPTVFTGVEPGMRIAQEEIFGPVLSILEFDDEQEAIDIANGVMYGLAAAVWTKDLGCAFRVAESIEAGIIWTNCTQYHPVYVPYEGHKVSGLGEDQGHEAVREFTRLKVHMLNFGPGRKGW